MSAQTLHTALLRVSILHILRAAGFHSTKSNVLDVVVNLAERYLHLLCTTVASHSILNHNTLTSTITDLRMAFADCGVLAPACTSSEEEWKEKLRRPLIEYESMPYGERRAPMIDKKRLDEDTRDVRDFLDWIRGAKNKELRRVAGMLPDARLVAASEHEVLEDFLSALKKKHSKTGEDARYAGTVLGRPADDKVLLIEGGPSESVVEWQDAAHRQAAKPTDDRQDVTMHNGPS